MLVKLTIGVNFINSLCVPFLYESVLLSFSLVTVWLCNFLRKNISAKAACKMLMKLTIGGERRKNKPGLKLLKVEKHHRPTMVRPMPRNAEEMESENREKPDLTSSGLRPSVIPDRFQPLSWQREMVDPPEREGKDRQVGSGVNLLVR